jgi:hypothetical protein
MNANGLKSPFKKDRLEDWVKKYDTTVYFLQKLSGKEIHRLKVKV